ncbi:MAG: hypothetical protein O2968_20460 [Acidobacteria bacterium]|nr:hypothetical protein [Acidobacteriota bacterium]
MIDIIALVSRWTHIAAAAVVVGGFVYARFVLFPAMSTLNEEAQAKLRGAIVANLRPWALTSIVLLVLSGSYNFYRVVQSGVDTAYHMAFGLKFLLALHVFGMLFVLSTRLSGDPKRDAKRPRLIMGALISGLIILALGAYLRTLHT